ncbi:hypothetical protein [uncultured Clostridium sp.]|uniref:hypothetical protein n=1 Tax=uncultured Clostridium sp. TaxID=59620 RepID=UPI00261922E5|nr:hypothetical protein [uncultured Clostridium sp.]
MMTFNAALEAYKLGKRIQSIVSNNIYSTGKIDIKNACNREKQGFWCLLKKEA